jgi:hypothetical protein
MNVAATITLTPGTVYQPLDLGPEQRLGRDQRPQRRRSRSRGTRPGAAPRRLSRARGSGAPAPCSQRLPLTPNRSDAGGRPLRQQRSTARISFLARESAPHRADALVGPPDRVELPHPEPLRERASVEAVSLRSRLADAGIRRRDDDHPSRVRLQHARNLPGVTGHLERDVVPARRGSARTARASRASSRSRRPSADHLVRRSPPRRSRAGRPAPLLSISVLLASLLGSRRTGGQTTSTDPRSQRNRPSRSGGQRKARARDPSSDQTAHPARALPQGPSSQSAKPKSTTRCQPASGKQFHAPKRSRAGADRTDDCPRRQAAVPLRF